MPPTRGETGLFRRWKLLVLLASARRPITRKALAEKFGVEKKTIANDIAELSSLGFDIEDEQSGGRGEFSYRTGPLFRLPAPISLGAEELGALYLARAQLAQVSGTPFEPDLDSACAKIACIVPEEVRRESEAMAAFVRVHVRGQPKRAPDRRVIADLGRAYRESRPCELVYARRGEAAEFRVTVHPQKLFQYHGGLYLLAWRPRRPPGFRTFAVENIRSVTILPGAYLKRPDGEIEREFGNAFGLYTGSPFGLKVRFSREVASYVAERTWNRGERVERGEDGSIVYSAEVSGPVEVAAWILGFGPKAEVLEPEWLRAKLAAEARETARLYEPARSGRAAG